MTNLIGLSIEDFKNICQTLEKPLFHADQIFNWLYHKGVQDVSDMKNIPLDFRNYLKEHYSIERPTVSKIQKSVDGTQKWLLNFNDNNEAECVHIPEKTRGTLCVSSQIGCTLTCTFCHTGTQVLVRNLTPAEIIGQVMTARDIFSEWPTPQEKAHISNIVMMGMGEPLYNYENVKKAILLMMHQKGIGLSRHKITLSTSGIIPGIKKTAEELRVNLALSLHAVTNELRNKIVPINKKYPLEELLPVIKDYCPISGTKKVTFEYVMLKDTNDSEADAKELIRLIKGIPSKINLIPFNPWPGAPFECSSHKQIKKFASILENAGYIAPVRTPRGQDIFAACGQLKSESERVKKSKINQAENAS